MLPPETGLQADTLASFPVHFNPVAFSQGHQAVVQGFELSTLDRFLVCLVNRAGAVPGNHGNVDDAVIRLVFEKENCG